MTELMIVAILLAAFGLVYFSFVFLLRRQRSMQAHEDLQSKIKGAKGKLAKLLGAPDVADENALDITIANWVGNPDKNIHLAGLMADSILEILKMAERLQPKANKYRGKSKSKWLELTSRILARVENSLDNLEVIIDHMKLPQ